MTLESRAASIYCHSTTEISSVLLVGHQDSGCLRFILEAKRIQPASDGDLSDAGSQQSGDFDMVFFVSDHGMLGLKR